jgi:uncharacterized protein YhfF
MFISVQFKDKNKVFKGKIYDYELLTDVVPKVGEIIRMVDKDNEPVCYGTRVKVVAVKAETPIKVWDKVNYLIASLED